MNFDRNKVFASVHDANYNADYIRVGLDGNTYLCRLDRSQIADGGMDKTNDELLALPAWQVCCVKKSGTDDNGNFMFLYPNGVKEYCYSCDDVSLSSFNFSFAV